MNLEYVTEDWEFNVLGIYNYLKPGRFDAVFKFIRENHNKISGDIVEAGVYRGNSLIAIGMLLRDLGSKKKVYGFDSFSGFPPIYNEKDNFEQFEVMFEKKQISTEHIKAVRRNRSFWSALHAEPNQQPVNNISSSGSFNETSKDLVRKKIEIMGLDNVILVDGPFSETMAMECHFQIMAAILDCDLYESYATAYKYLWPQLVVGGMVHLDEYYSLKFPGARMATDEFIRGKKAKLEKHEQKKGDFERWHLYKCG